MSVRDLFLTAARRLWRRRGRAVLTAGGILVGVLMVSLVFVIGAAGESAVNSELENMGLRGVSVSAVSGELTAEDLTAVREAPGVDSAMPLLLVGGTGELGQHTFSAFAAGIDAGADQVIALETAYGRMLHAGDVRTGAAVCLVDEEIAAAAYGHADAVGKTLTLQMGEVSLTLEVVGVAAAGSSLLQSVSGYLPGLVYLPYTTLQEAVGQETFHQIAVRVSGETDADTVRGRVLTALERESGNTGGYTAENLAAQRERLSSLMDTVGWVLAAVSAASLLVAGMGILTSMLTAVGERVREIGVKQALGATRRRILLEFLAESVLLSAAGGAAGVVLGALIGGIGVSLAGLSVTLPVGRFLLLWVSAVALGGLFGWYPARKAARLCPVEALRENG